MSANKFRPMRYLVNWHNQGILDVNSLVWAPKLSTQIKEKVMQEKVLEMLIHLFLKQKCSYVEKTIKFAMFPIMWGLGQNHS